LSSLLILNGLWPEVEHYRSREGPRAPQIFLIFFKIIYLFLEFLIENFKILNGIF